MRIINHFFVLSTVVIYQSCNTVRPSVIQNQSIETNSNPTILIWNGEGKASRYINNDWVRDETYDYQFTVVQKRFPDHWESTKTLHRLHPDYDGKAGQRDQHMYFRIEFNKADSNDLEINLVSTLGNGSGHTDHEFRNSNLLIQLAGSSGFLPYNQFEITQHYLYEDGKLEETVLLSKQKNGTETLFMKNEESANIFIHSSLDGPPSMFN